VLIAQDLLETPDGKRLAPLPAQQEFVELDRQGEWHKVVVLSGACEDTYAKEPLPGQIGWIRFTDEKTGTPLVWWYTRGC
jgi:hypothetical protein